jgi:hypothetical protein
MAGMNPSAVTGSTGAYIAAMSKPLPPSTGQETPFDMMRRSGGDMSMNMVTLDKNGANKQPVFSFMGLINIEALAIQVMMVNDSTTLSGVKLIIDDGAQEIDLCAATDLSGVASQDAILKTGNAATPLTVMPGGQVRMIEGKLEGCWIKSKPGMDPSTVAIAYTGDANTDVQVTVFCKYTSFNPSMDNLMPVMPPPV